MQSNDSVRRFNNEIFKPFDPKSRFISTNLSIKNKLKDLLSEVKKCK